MDVNLESTFQSSAAVDKHNPRETASRTAFNTAYKNVDTFASRAGFVLALNSHIDHINGLSLILAMRGGWATQLLLIPIKT